jgi:protein TonB
VHGQDTGQGGPAAAGAASADGGAGGGMPGSGGGSLALAVPGDGGDPYASYLAMLRRRVHEAMRYPAAARRRGLTGTVHLDIVLEPSGRIADVALARSSSHGVLDDAALDAVRSLGRVPFPDDVRPRALRVRLPVVFELR